MILKKKIDVWRCFASDEKFFAAFAEVRALLERRAGTVLGEDTESKRPRLILKSRVPSLDDAQFVLKREWFSFRLDRTLKSLLCGSNARIVFATSVSAEAAGFTDFCRTFFVAERSRFGVLKETISVIEFLDGHWLADEGTLLEPAGGTGWAFPEKTREEARDLLERCHRTGIVSGDVHPGNFFRMRDTGTLKLIDFRGRKRFSAVAEARDRVQMEYIMNIPNLKHDAGEKIFRALLAFRNLFRRLRGRELHHY